ncbi:MAG: hypothetical protein ABFC62_06765 [Clostridiaceae bacterium]
MSIDIVLAVALIAAAFLIGFYLGRSGKTKNVYEHPGRSAEAETAEDAGAAAPQAAYIPNRGQFAAAVSAAIATYLGEGVEGLRIRSIRRLSGGDTLHRPMVAAMSAAIATHMGTDVSGLRIHSIRRVGAPATDRGHMVAAISAAIATAMNTQIDGLRIHSIKKIS